MQKQTKLKYEVIGVGCEYVHVAMKFLPNSFSSCGLLYYAATGSY